MHGPMPINGPLRSGGGSLLRYANLRWIWGFIRIYGWILFFLSGINAAGEGFTLLVNRTSQPIAIEMIAAQQDWLTPQQGAALPPVLGPGNMILFRSTPNVIARLRADSQKAFDVALSPNVVVIVDSLPQDERSGSYALTVTKMGRDDDLASAILELPKIHVSKGYRCMRWIPGEVGHRIPVKLLVDDEEAATPAVWQARLVRRIKDVNEILMAFCGVYLEIVSFDSWESDDRLSDIEDGFREFVAKVDPHPASLAIGFSAQWSAKSLSGPLGMSVGPLTSHILVREYGAGITESERIEILLHELGHYLGAAHVPDDGSVMRSRLEKRPSRDRSFAIGFDPINTLVINTAVDELRAGRRRVADFSPGACESLRAWYDVISRADPEDNTAVHLAALLPSRPAESSLSTVERPSPSGNQADTARPESGATQPADESQSLPTTKRDVTLAEDRTEPQQTPKPPEKLPSSAPVSPSLHESKGQAVVESPPKQSAASGHVPAPEERPNLVAADVPQGARIILQQIVQSWSPPRPEDIPRGLPVGDYILEGLVRRAAEVAIRLDVDEEAKRRGAFLLAIAVVSDDSNFVRNQPGLGEILQQIESDDERKLRLSRIGIATIFGRHDWAQHFCVSAGLVCLLGAGPTRSLGLAKEWRDSQGDSGWSFADLGADFAGIRFGEAILKGEIPLEDVHTGFQIADFVPPLADYPEDIPFTRFVATYGGLFGQPTRTILAEIDKAIQALPGYQRANR